VIAATTLQGYRTMISLAVDHTIWQLANICITSAVTTYIFLLTSYYIFTASVTQHNTLTFHLFLLLCALCTHLYFATIGQYLAFTLFPVLTWTDYTILILTLTETIAVGFIPLKPPVHEDKSKLYNNAIRTALKEVSNTQDSNEVDRDEPEANVTADGSASIISQLFFGWVTPTITKMSLMEQCDIQDLPSLRAQLRTQNVVRHILQDGDASILKSRWGPTVALLWTVWAPQWVYLAQGESHHSFSITQMDPCRSH
jgi:hypothetical protein